MAKNELPHVNTYIPIGIGDLNKQLDGTGLCPDVMRGILHQLYLVRAFQSMNSKKSKTYSYRERWVPLKSDVIKIIAGRRDYSKYMNWLESRNYVVPKRNSKGAKGYLAGRFCINYKINPSILNIENDTRSFKKEHITKYKVLKRIKNIAKYFKQTYSKNKRKSSLLPIHENLIEMAYSVRFDVEKAKAIYPSVSEEQINMLEAINDGSIHIGMVDKFGERLYTPFTNLKKNLRICMYFKDFPNEKLGSIDFTNSQFYFLGLITNTELINKFLPEFSACSKYFDNINQNEDTKLFNEISSCLKHSRYESIYDYWKRIRKIEDRKLAQKELFHLTFSSLNSKKVSNEIRSTFNNHFPSINKFVANIKSLSETELPFILELENYKDEFGLFIGKDSYHKNISCMLQRIESRVIIKEISPLLIDAGITPFITIHDSFIVLEKHKKAAKKIIKGYFNKMGFSPPGLK